MIWGEKYSDRYVDTLVRDVKSHSASCAHVVLITDRIRKGLTKEIEQKLIPAFFDKQVFFKGGYVVKLSLFHRNVLPRDMPCVYLDLDTIVVGDVGKIAALVTGPGSYFMLPPASLFGFGPIRRWLYKQTNGRRFATGNSSIVAFHSSTTPNICEEFERLYRGGMREDRKMKIDDVFISWFAQPALKAVPSSLAVMFRREFLSRSSIMLEFKRRSLHRAKRRNNLVAVTFNGAQHKPEEFLTFREGDRIFDEKNRFGIWSADYLGDFKAKIIQFAEKVRGT